MRWYIVADNSVQHIWQDSKGKEHAIHPTYYQNNGTPCDDEGDMTYVRTEIFTDQQP